MSLGPFIRNIRIEKGLSQIEVSDLILTQSNYSKFELGKIEVSASALLKIIDNLELTFDEFFYLYEIEHNNPKNDIINQFFNLTYNQPDKLKKLRIEAEKYLSQNSKESPIIQDIIRLSNALELISIEKNYDNAKKLAVPIWDRLQKRDRWYLTEIMLLNSILYIFPLDTAESIVKKSSDLLDLYINHDTYARLKINLNSNIALLNIKQQNINKAERYLDIVINLTQSFDHEIAKKIAEFRLTYCKASLDQPFSSELMLILMYLKSTGKVSLLSALKNEADKYCTNPEFLQKVNELEEQIHSIIP